MSGFWNSNADAQKVSSNETIVVQWFLFNLSSSLAELPVLIQIRRVVVIAALQIATNERCEVFETIEAARVGIDINVSEVESSLRRSVWSGE